MAQNIEAEISPEYLQNLTQGLGTGPEPAPDGAVPEGNYTAQLTEVFPGVSQSGGAYINLTFTILGPSDEQQGAEQVAHFNLITPENFGVFKKTLRRLGIRDNEGPAVVAALQAKIGTVWNITVKYNQGFVNVYVNREVKSPAAQTA